MMRKCAGLVAMAVVMWAGPAHAQTAGPSGPAVNLWYGGVFAGASVVENTGGLVGAEAGIRAIRNLDVFVEAGWMQDVVTRRRLQSTRPLVDYLEAVHSTPAAASVEAPAVFGAIGGRWVFEREGAFRPYVVATIGVASVEYKPSFSLGGTDVTGAIANYGITLGRDIKGKETKAMLGAGAGVLYVHGAWYADGGIRVSSIKTDGQSTNVSRASVGFGLRF